MTEAQALQLVASTWEPTPPARLAADELHRTVGFLVADPRGRVVGRSKGSAPGTSSDEQPALAIHLGFLRHRLCVVPADAIEHIDERMRVVGVRLERKAIRALRGEMRS